MKIKPKPSQIEDCNAEVGSNIKLNTQIDQESNKNQKGISELPETIRYLNDYRSADEIAEYACICHLFRILQKEAKS